MKATGTFRPTKWDEKTIDQISIQQKMTKASVILTFDKGGAIEGEADVEWLMFYSHADEKDQHNSMASYIGLIRFIGSLNGKSGSFVMDDRGTFEAGEAKSEMVIVAGSGTGELVGITGTAESRSSANKASFEIEYELKGVVAIGPILA